ncbi:winged helix DNA-binding domain-containing protein [Marinobacterium sp. D7]|uniref:winged helix-turn-helix domain-containing protein n=1 Tax=Marinobacterium ramblicola TaxID=2849041 RepID=UPI001C2CCD06|nr:crosslink repair DNA glycosylase YcaQ family protein [Marinobacterium ramblicola]MBV1787522.1 winged helix DNA-binding domain-containing protein [Marinobacterium ramblicola]
MTQQQMRRLALARQGLASPQPFGSGCQAVLRAIEHLGYVQIDALSVVERAHHHTLWARVADYAPAQLNQLLGERRIFEYWSHAAAYLPMRDYRFALPRMNAIRNGTHPYFSNVDARLMREILARVRGEGELHTRALSGSRSDKGSWWNWGPGRRALDKLFMQGDLMVSERNGMQKVYDLAERVLPTGVDLREPTRHEYAAYLLDGTVRAHGLVTFKQVMHLNRDKALKAAMRDLLTERIDAGQLTAVENKALPDSYIDTRLLNPPSSEIQPGRVQLLSPFDNAVIHRDRLNRLFGFDYRLECYLPATKRVYGYFCLPILLGDRFIGRIDCKARRAEQRFEVLSLHIEDSTVDKTELAPLLDEAIREFAKFNGCEY